MTIASAITRIISRSPPPDEVARDIIENMGLSPEGGEYRRGGYKHDQPNVLFIKQVMIQQRQYR